MPSPSPCDTRCFRITYSVLHVAAQSCAWCPPQTRYEMFSWLWDQFGSLRHHFGSMLARSWLSFWPRQPDPLVYGTILSKVFFHGCIVVSGCRGFPSWLGSWLASQQDCLPAGWLASWQASHGQLPSQPATESLEIEPNPESSMKHELAEIGESINTFLRIPKRTLKEILKTCLTIYKD